MTNIGFVIGWKFNHQLGMCTRNGVITEFPGGIPSQADQDTWTAEYLLQFPEGFDEWKESIQATDSGMPRYLEDLISRKQYIGVLKNYHINILFDRSDIFSNFFFKHQQ